MVSGERYLSLHYLPDPYPYPYPMTLTLPLPLPLAESSGLTHCCLRHYVERYPVCCDSERGDRCIEYGHG